MSHWRTADIGLVFVMWAVMMAAMMLPSAVPLLVLLVRINRQRHGPNRALLATGVTGLGYLTAWAGFSVLATLAQWGLLEARLVTPMMKSSSPYLSGALLAAAGAYQFTTWKFACLSRCRSPLSQLMMGGGAFLLGLRQGVYCTGCCWLLMVLLFVLGVMNLLWVAALTLLILLEKALRQPRWFVHLVGAALLVWAALIISQLMVQTIARGAAFATTSAQASSAGSSDMAVAVLLGRPGHLTTARKKATSGEDRIGKTRSARLSERF